MDVKRVTLPPKETWSGLGVALGDDMWRVWMAKTLFSALCSENLNAYSCKVKHSFSERWPEELGALIFFCVPNPLFYITFSRSILICCSFLNKMRPEMKQPNWNTRCILLISFWTKRSVWIWTLHKFCVQTVCAFTNLKSLWSSFLFLQWMLQYSYN